MDRYRQRDKDARFAGYEERQNSKRLLMSNTIALYYSQTEDLKIWTHYFGDYNTVQQKSFHEFLSTFSKA